MDGLERKCLSTEQEVPWRRVLDASKGSGDCSSIHVKYPLVSQSGMHQLHIFICMLAVLHFLHSILTVALARTKDRSVVGVADSLFLLDQLQEGSHHRGLRSIRGGRQMKRNELQNKNVRVVRGGGKDLIHHPRG